MKQLIYLAGLVVALFLSSCETEVLHPNSLDEDQFWKTEADAQAGLISVYNMNNKKGMYARWYWMRTDITSDEGYSLSGWATLKEWTQFIYNNYNMDDGGPVDTFHDCYITIYRANQVLAFVPDIEFANEEDKDILLAQAHFLRGIAYYQLATLWGSENKSLPIALEPSKPGDVHEGYNMEEAYEQAISDFEEATELDIPEEWDGANKGRATYGAAKAYMAKCYMQMRDFQSAAEHLQWLADGEGKRYYGLQANYQDNFDVANENNRESVYEIQFSDVNEGENQDFASLQSPNLGNHRGMVFGTPGNGWSDANLRQWVVDEFKKELDNDTLFDIRLKWTAYYDGMHEDFEDNNMIFLNDLTINNLFKTGDWQQNGTPKAYIRKWNSQNYTDKESLQGATNVRLLRYADVLLLYAECLAEIGQPISYAAGFVNQVRNRANMPNLEDSLDPDIAACVNDKDAFLRRLRTERVLELCTEGHRWEDIKRWQLLSDKNELLSLQSRDPDFLNITDLSGKYYCMPIPSSETTNNLNLEQNPGY